MSEPTVNPVIQLNISEADFDNILYCIRVARQHPQTDDNGIDVLTFLRQKLLIQKQGQNSAPTIAPVSE